MKNKRAVIVGGSIAGLLAGSMLRRIGWQVDIFERVDGPLEGRGAGITILPGLPEAFRAAGVTEQQLGIDLPLRRVIDVKGNVLAERIYSQGMTSWSRLFELAKATFPESHYHRGMSLERYEQHAERISAHFTNGERVDADLLIGADGLRSTVRAQMLPQAKANYAGYIAWRCLVDENLVSTSTYRELVDRYTICAAPGEQGIAYTVPGPNYNLTPGQRQLNVVWYHPVRDDDLAGYFTDDAGRYYPQGIPPALLSKRVRDAMIATAQSGLAPAFAETIRLSPIHFFQPIYDLEPDHLADRRVAIIGDAGYIIRPHTAMGVVKGGGDAMLLAQSISESDGDLEQALPRFEAARMRTGRSILQRGKYLGAYMEAQVGSAEQRQRAEQTRTPEYSLETAMPVAYE